MTLEKFIRIHLGEPRARALQELRELAADIDHPERTATRFTPLYAVSYDELLYDIITEDK